MMAFCSSLCRYCIIFQIEVAPVRYQNILLLVFVNFLWHVSILQVSAFVKFNVCVCYYVYFHSIQCIETTSWDDRKDNSAFQLSQVFSLVTVPDMMCLLTSVFEKMCATTQKNEEKNSCFFNFEKNVKNVRIVSQAT